MRLQIKASKQQLLETAAVHADFISSGRTANTWGHDTNSTWLVTSRRDTTRHLAHAFWHTKKSWRSVSRLSDSTARHARNVVRVVSWC